MNKVVNEKPANMTKEAYGWLKTLSFGANIFDFPRDVVKPIPEIIVAGDLDGN
jgi:hypothetical protein